MNIPSTNPHLKSEDFPSISLEEFTQQEELFKGVDKEKEFANKNVLRYTLIGAGSIVVLIAFKYFISKRK